MKNTEMEKQQRYHNLLNEGRSIGLMITTGNRLWEEANRNVVGVLDDNIDFESYVKEVSELTGFKLSVEDGGIGFQYMCGSRVVLIPDVDARETSYELGLRYKDDEDFLYHGCFPNGEICINSANDRAGWRDLRDNDDLTVGIYDYFINDEDPNTLLRYNKPVNKGDYTGQTPVVVDPMVY